MIKVYKYSQLERITYLRPIDEPVDVDRYGEPNIGNYLTDTELQQLKEEYFNAGKFKKVQWPAGRTPGMVIETYNSVADYDNQRRRDGKGS